MSLLKNSDEKKAITRKYSFFVLILSVLAALVLWFYVQEAESPDYKKTFSAVRVEIQSLSSSLSVIGVDEITVDITLVGKRSDLNKIKTDDLEAYMDLSSVSQPGTYYSDINVLVPQGTELSECFPKVATLLVDQTVSATVPVKVELGKYSLGEHMVLEAIPAVSEILVKGPKTILDEIDCAKIRTGDLGTLSASFESNLEYMLYDKNGNEVNSKHVPLAVRNIRVKFQVYKTKLVPFTVQTQNGWWTTEQMQYTVSPSTVMIKGSPALIDSIHSIPAAVINESRVDSDTLSLTVTPDRLPLPSGVSLAETLGDVKISLNLPDNQSRVLTMQLNSTHVAVTPPSGEWNYQFADAAISFKIRGTSQAINQAEINDFYLNIDLSGLTAAGEYTVPVQIVQTSASQGQYYPVGDVTVTVSIQAQ